MLGRLCRSSFIALCCAAAYAAPFAQSRPPDTTSTPVAWLVFVDDLHLDFRNTGRIRDLVKSMAAELIREKILDETYEEIPHSIAVEIEQFQETKRLARISAAILVEKESQKAIVIGKQGERLKRVGAAARQDMERLFGIKVFLEMWVKVQDAWREDERVLAELGY